VLERSGLTGLPTALIGARWWPAFRQRFSRLGVGAAAFEAFFGPALREAGTGKGIEGLRRAFASLDPQERGVLDGLELFAALAVLSQGGLDEKVAVLFDLFDLGGRGRLGRDALGLLIERTVSGLQKSCACLGLEVPDGLSHAMAGRAFHDRGDDEEMTAADFRKWWHYEGLVRRGLRRFVADPQVAEAGLPNEASWHWEEARYEVFFNPRSQALGQEDEEGMDAAAVKIQAVHRGKAARRQVEESKAAAAEVAAADAEVVSSEEATTTAMKAEEEAAAVKIQAVHRGKSARRALDAGTGDAPEEPTTPLPAAMAAAEEAKAPLPAAPVDDTEAPPSVAAEAAATEAEVAEQEAAATRIQAKHRGNAARRGMDAGAGAEVAEVSAPPAADEEALSAADEAALATAE